MELCDLASNLQELYCGIVKPKAEVKSCDQIWVANYSETAIYEASSGWGRLWRWIYNLLEFLYSKNFRQRKLFATVAKTHSAFAKKIDEMENRLQEYDQLLKKKLHSISLSREEKEAFFLVKCEIVEVIGQLLPFIQLIHKSSLSTIQQLFASCLGDVQNPFLCEIPISKRMIAISELFEIEQTLLRPLPYGSLAKLGRGGVLEKSELQKLALWIYCLKSHSDEISVGTLHRSLLALSTLLEEGSANPNSICQKMELALFERGLDALLLSDDKELTQWRAQIKPGDLVEGPSEECWTVQGRMESRKSPDCDQFHYFTVKEEPDALLMVANNPARINLMQMSALYRKNVLLNAKIFYLDPLGRFATVEKLSSPLSRHSWSSMDSFSREERARLATIAGWVRWMIEKDVCPKTLSADHIMFNERGHLRSSKVRVAHCFNYPLLEDFFADVAAENPLIFTSLMEGSGLYHHPQRAYFVRVAENALSSNPFSVESIGAENEIRHSFLIERAEQLDQQIRRLYAQLTRGLESRLNEAQLRGIVRRCLLGFLEKYRVAVALNRGLEESFLQDAHRLLTEQAL